MAKLTRLAGSTGHILALFVQDSSKTDGSGLAGLTASSSGLTCYYKRNTASGSVAVTLTGTGTLGTYTSGLFKEVDSVNMPGFYEFHPPDTAYASGAKSVAFLLRGAASMVPCAAEVELSAVDNQDGTAYGLSRLDASVSSRSTYAGADTAGTTTLLSRVTAAVALAGSAPSWYTAPVDVSANVSAIKAKTDNLPSDPAGLAALASAHGGGSWATAAGFATPGAAMTLTTAEEAAIADTVLRRSTAHVQASAAGDTLSVRSLYGFLCQAQHASAAGAVLTVSNPDSSTLGTLTLTLSAGASPVSGVQ